MQSEIVRSAYEDYVGQVTQMGEIVTDMAKSAYKPYEALLRQIRKVDRRGRRPADKARTNRARRQRRALFRFRAGSGRAALHKADFDLHIVRALLPPAPLETAARPDGNLIVDGVRGLSAGFRSRVADTSDAI